MKRERNFSWFLRNLGRKHRLSLRDQHDDGEVWYMHITPLKLVGGLVAVVLVLFIVVLTVAAYVPVLDLIPGYGAGRQREMLVGNIMRLDSIENRLNELQAWGDGVAVIMDGKTPVLRNTARAGDSTRVSRPETVLPDAADSLLRHQMEGGGIYGLQGVRATTVPSSALGLITPVAGVVGEHFAPREGVFGVGIATAVNRQVVAVADGTVTLATWSPDEGYIIQMQHSGNLLSIYRHAAQALHPVGTRVAGGQVIAFTGEGLSGEGGKGLFGFELWQDGSPLDPENFIVF